MRAAGLLSCGTVDDGCINFGMLPPPFYIHDSNKKIDNLVSGFPLNHSYYSKPKLAGLIGSKQLTEK